MFETQSSETKGPEYEVAGLKTAGAVAVVAGARGRRAEEEEAPYTMLMLGRCIELLARSYGLPGDTATARDTVALLIFYHINQVAHGEC